ncbi:MAG TPA: LysR substrate-binding domain-containing protein [Haliscomenobacter sp.]|uniref:LysR substrate-binding domain-containing protein n=1 Tax=Haliscomenobacter sp. TaxID=2717303 RepID=UPI002C178396|nr:LysR substrate-binding domain-containing protein [Haliscomenobacter sp.]HOY20096.1 LysR substrate-binding domain-containing protein [Haliscomenobacter sp.]
MDLRQLRSFTILAEELHFGRAANKLFIVQPALSKQIQELEKELKVSLFTRNKRKVSLTPAGIYLWNEAKHLLAQVEEIRNHLPMIERGEQGEIRLGYVGSCIHTFLPEILVELNQRYPAVQTYLSEMTTASQLEALQKGMLDVAFVRNPPFDARWDTRLMYRETFALVLPADHPVEAINFPGLSAFASEKFILTTRQDGAAYHHQQLSICQDAGFYPHIVHETVHGHTVLQLIEKRLGISLLPTSFCRVTTAAVKFIELKDIPQRAEITALWERENPNPVLRGFLEVLVREGFRSADI